VTVTGAVIDQREAFCITLRYSKGLSSDKRSKFRNDDSTSRFAVSNSDHSLLAVGGNAVRGMLSGHDINTHQPRSSLSAI
jgi:hypothetical protein